jgi:hypothetical protein
LTTSVQSPDVAFSPILSGVAAPEDPDVLAGCSAGVVALGEGAGELGELEPHPESAKTVASSTTVTPPRTSLFVRTMLAPSSQSDPLRIAENSQSIALKTTQQSIPRGAVPRHALAADG